MQKLFGWLDKNFLKIGIAIFLVFIPLYPKLPLIDVHHTWVYIRLEDFFVAILVAFWLWQLWRKKVSLKSPLSLPILVYWFVGGLSLLFALVFLQSKLANWSPSVAILHYFRRVEYMLLFFIALTTIKDLKTVKKYLLALAVAMTGVCFYSLGQKFLGWPAFLTMNEEFSKGLPLYLPPTARITATFGGHYDLAAWLVLTISLWGSLIFGLKKSWQRAASFLLALVGFVLLLFTASRISFAAYLLAISLALFLQKKKWLIIPVIFVSIFLMNYVTGASQRFGKTFRVENVVYDLKTGKPIGTLEDESRIGEIITEEEEIAGEDLPLGSGYIPLPLTESPELTDVAVVKQPIFTTLKTATKASEIATISGEFLIKRALVYDISFTTRFQGTWPRALKAFQRNPLLGSGYASIGLASDSSFLRAIGETGLLGFLAFFSVFFAFFLLAKQGLKKITTPFAKSILIGVVAGLAGLILNAVLIDVFEASKVAFTLWPLLGITVGVVKLYLPRRKNLLKEAFKIMKHPIVPAIFLAILAPFIFYTSFKNYFVGDDFTWLRWAATAKADEIYQFFISSQGFFYRPLAKIYFLFAYPAFGLKSQGYHLVDFFLHFGCVLGGYLLSLQLTRKKELAFLVALLFLVHPVGAEAVLWISSTSILLANFFYLWGVLAGFQWAKGKGRWRYLWLALAYLAFVFSLASHELAVTFPLMILWIDWLWGRLKKTTKKNWFGQLAPYFLFAGLTGFYFWLRNSVAESHWLSGDYNYNWAKLPFNFAGNILGYLGELVASFHFLPLYDWLRACLRDHKVLALGILTVALLIAFRFFKKIKLSRLVLFSLGWFLIILLPFLGLGNIAERYVHLARLGFFIILVLGVDWLYFKLKRFKLGVYLVILLVLGFLTFYGWEMEKAKRSWYQAGEIVNKILLTLSSNWSEFAPGVTLYFVNLPIRYERAWVFPVGLEDSLWFIYRDESLVIKQMVDLEETVRLITGKFFVHAFLYEDGELKLISI